MGSPVATLRATVLVSMSLLALTAGAEEDDVARARALFREGLSLVDQERFGEAAEVFEEAYELRASPAIAFNLAAALERDGQRLSAAGWLDTVLDDPSTKPEIRRLAEELSAQVDAELARITVRLEGPPSGVAVRVGARELGLDDIGRPVRSEPGAVEVRALRDGTVVASETIQLEKGAAREVSLVIPEVAPVGGGESGEGAVKPLAKKWWFWTAVGGGVALIALTAIVAGTSDKVKSPVPGNAMPTVLEWR